MRKYRVTFHLHERKRVTHSPLTGKEYKRPRIESNWISLSETFKAESLKRALKLVQSIAELQGWTIDGVDEV